MNRKKLATYGFFIGISEAAGTVSALLTKDGMDRVMALPKSSLTPPAILFPIVWGILFLLMGIGAARVWLSEESTVRSRGLSFFLFQLIFNFFWSLLYFNMQWFGIALFWLVTLWILIALMTLNFRKTDRLAGWLQIPYLLWVGFAGYLNYVTWMLHR